MEGCAVCGGGRPLDCSLDFAGAFLDANFAEVIWRGCGWGGGEADAVIGDGEVELVICEGRGDFDLGGLSVFEGVGEGFLSDHAKMMNGRARE